MNIVAHFPILPAPLLERYNTRESDMTYEASSEIVDLGTASLETKGAPGTPFPDNYGDRPQEGLSDD